MALSIYVVAFASFLLAPEVALASLLTTPEVEGNCLDCESRTDLAFGDFESHISVHLKGVSNFSKPICYDLVGKDGEVYNLFKDGSLKVDAKLVRSPRLNQQAFFGKMVFLTRSIMVAICPESITFVGPRHRVSVVPWSQDVPKTDSMVFHDNQTGFIVEHFQNDVIKVQCGESEYQVKRNQLKYGENDEREFRFLGVYLIPAENATYEGIIGEMITKEATLKSSSGSPLNLDTTGSRRQIFINGSPIGVKESTRVRMVDGKQAEFSCWKVEDIETLLKNPLSSYSRSRN